MIIIKTHLLKHHYKTNVRQINEGDLVKLNYDRITSSNDYYTRNKKYCQFIEENKDNIFKAHFESDNHFQKQLISLGNDIWLFHNTDLLLIDIK